MSDELQEVQETEIVQDVVEQEEVEGTPEEAPAEENEGEKLSGYDKRISVLTARLRHAEQQLAQEKAEKVTKQTLEEVREAPAIPEFPEDDLKYSDPAEYKRQLRARDEAIAEAAAFRAERALDQRRENEAKRKQAETVQSQYREIVNSYIDNGLKQGISEDRMAANEQVLKEFSINSELAKHIYADQYGAKVVDFLARNPDQLAEIAGMSIAAAAVKIATEIKPKALAKKPHVTNAPDPVAPTRGSGKPLGNEWESIAKGATFE